MSEPRRRYTVWEYSNRTYVWENEDGERHRDGGPAVEYSNGTRKWFQHDKLHRDDGPAIVHANGTKKYYYRGELHRDDGPAEIIVSEGGVTTKWRKYGKLHRDNGPAVEFFNGAKEYWVDGVLHNEDGPAVIFYDGHALWYLHGRKMTMEEHEDETSDLDDAVILTEDRLVAPPHTRM